MPEGNGGGFPLVDRPTPFADRVRDRVTQNNLGEAMGKRLGEFLNSEDEMAKAQVAEELGSGFKSSLAEEIDVPEEHISDEVVSMMAELFTEPTADEVLTEEAKESLGLISSREDEEQEEPSFDPDETVEHQEEDE